VYNVMCSGSCFLPVFTQGLAKVVKDGGTVANAIVDMRLKADTS